MVVDNSDNTHSCSYYWVFSGKIELVITNRVDTIGGKYLHKKGIGTVFWSWTYDKRELRSDSLKYILYFSDLPVKMLSATVMAKSIKDDKGI